MKEKVYLLAVGLFLTLHANSQELSSYQDSLSYAYGIMLANEVEGKMVEGIDIEKVKKGYEAKMEGTLSDEWSKEAKFIKMRAINAAKEKAAEKYKTKSADFLTNIAQEEGVMEGEGYYYKVLTEGSGESPNPGDVVTIHYEGSLMDGTVFDSSYERGKAATFDLDRLIKGWQLAVPEMKVGGKRRLYLPYNLAYGERGNRSIPPYSTLIFDIELIDFEQ